MDENQYAALQFHLKQVESILTAAVPQVQNGIVHIIDSKSTVLTIRQVIDVLDSRSLSLKLLVSRQVDAEKTALKKVKTTLDALDKKFAIVHQPPIISRQFRITALPGVTVTLPYYPKLENMPLMTHGIMVRNRIPYVVFRYSKTKYVSCSGMSIAPVEGQTENFRTLSCTNSSKCPWGDKCRYYHDPLLFPDSNHVQRTFKTQMVKNYPYFGQASLLEEQLKTLTFENLRALARYLSTMILVVGYVAQTNER